MITIYGLREIGDQEIRYIGRSGDKLDRRLTKHIQNAIRRNYPPKISGWIREARNIEIVPLAQCELSAAAREERKTVEHYIALGNRLTNSHLVPRQTGAAA